MNKISKIRDLIRLVTKNSDNYDKRYMEIKSNSDDELPFKISSIRIVVRAVFHENNKYPKVFLDSCFYKW